MEIWYDKAELNPPAIQNPTVLEIESLIRCGWTKRNVMRLGSISILKSKAESSRVVSCQWYFFSSYRCCFLCSFNWITCRSSTDDMAFLRIPRPRWYMLALLLIHGPWSNSFALVYLGSHQTWSPLFYTKFENTIISIPASSWGYKSDKRSSNFVWVMSPRYSGLKE